MSTDPEKLYLVMEVDGSRMMEPPEVKLATMDFDMAWKKFFGPVTEYFKNKLKCKDDRYFYPEDGKLYSRWEDIEEKMMEQFNSEKKFVIQAGCSDWDAEEPFIIMIREAKLQ